jgi:hypothetical protein
MFSPVFMTDLQYADKPVKRKKTTDIFQWPMQIILFFLFDGGVLILYARFSYSYAHENRVPFFFCGYLAGMFFSFILHLPEEFKLKFTQVKQSRQLYLNIAPFVKEPFQKTSLLQSTT